MKHPTTRELFDYWNDKRGSRLAPERNDIDPARIKRALADTFILAFDARAGHPFRLAGTRLCALFARELKGEIFVSLWDVASRPMVRDLLDVVAHESVGVVASASARNADNQPVALELVVLPLHHRGRTDLRVLGALSPIEVPYWIGMRAIAALSLGTLRYVGPMVDEIPRQRGVSLIDGRLRRGLVVFEGGRK